MRNKRFLAAVLTLFCFSTTGCDLIGGNFEPTQSNTQNNQNSGQQSQSSNGNNENVTTFLPVSEIKEFYSSYGLNVIVPDYVTSNKDARCRYSKDDDKCAFYVAILGSNETEFSNYGDALKQNGWEGESDEFECENGQAIVVMDLEPEYVEIDFVVEIEGQHVENKPVTFWSSFGSVYSNVLEGIIGDVAEGADFEIKHDPKNSYDGIYQDMLSSLAVGDYPNLATGYPDHFISYLGSGILTPLNEYFSEAELADYYETYLVQNRFYDNGRQNVQERLYGIPFSKTTELLGYNGVFVDYCASIDPSLANIPATWEDWAVQGPKYDAIYQGMFGKGLYGVQDVFGTASQFELLYPVDGKLPGEVDSNGNIIYNGRTLLLDLTGVDMNRSTLMAWESTDNAFITLVKQWGAEYTNVDPSENPKIVRRRVGSVLFNSAQYQSKVVDMLKFFNKLNKAHIFGTPKTPLNAPYCADAFRNNQVMFVICASDSLSLLANNWHSRLRVTHIPYKDEDHKMAMSLGANICMTDKGNFEQSIELIKKITTGKYQTNWCLNTGFYPSSKSAQNSIEYQSFLHEDQLLVGGIGGTWVDMTKEEAMLSGAYNAPVRVAYRESAKLNYDEYMNPSKEWRLFVDPAFVGSNILRESVKPVFDSVFSITDVENDAYYRNILNKLQSLPNIKGCSTIEFVY